MSINIFSEDDSLTDDINQLRYTTKSQNDANYINTTGDRLAGDLNMSGNTIYFDTNRNFSIYNTSDILGLEVPGKLSIRGEGNDNYLLFIDKNQINCYNKPLKNVANPVDENDVVNKKYVDSKQQGEKIILKDTKAEILYVSGNDFNGTVFKNLNGVAFTDFQDNTLFTISSNIFVNNKRIINLANPTSDKDAVNLSYLKSHVIANRNCIKDYSTFIPSGNSKIISITNNDNWSIVSLTVKCYDKRISVQIPRALPNIDYECIVRGDGKPGDTSYKYTYYGLVRITNVRNDNVLIIVSNFGYSEDKTTSFSSRDDSPSYGVEHVSIL